jgi:hypothetical protein
MGREAEPENRYINRPSKIKRDLVYPGWHSFYEILAPKHHEQ